MSIQAIAWVLDHSASTGLDRLVLIALANHANAETGECRPGYRRIAHEANCSRATVGNAVDRLVAIGEVVVVERGKGRGTSKYHLPWLSTGFGSVHPGVDARISVASNEGPVASNEGPVASIPGVDESLNRKLNRARADANDVGGAKNPTRSAREIRETFDRDLDLDGGTADPETAQSALDQARARIGRPRS